MLVSNQRSQDYILPALEVIRPATTLHIEIIGCYVIHEYTKELVYLTFFK